MVLLLLLLLLLICCFACFPLVGGGGGLVFVFILLCIALCPFWFCNNLEEEERAGCFAFVVLRMSSYCMCSLTLPHGAVGWSAVYDCSIS